MAPFLLLLASLLLAAPATAQQQGGQEWFVPGQQQRPAQAQPAQGQQQRPAQGQPAQGQRPAAGQRPPAPIIGIVDIPEVQRLSAAFNQVREEVERRRARLNEDLQREQGRWRDQQQQLAAARATLPPEELRNRERELQERIADSTRIFRDRARNIDQATQQALQQIQQALGAVIRQVASSRGVNLVLPREQTIYSEPGFDLTEEISAQLNRSLRSVPLPVEEGAAPEASSRPATPAPAQPAPARAQPQAPRN